MKSFKKRKFLLFLPVLVLCIPSHAELNDEQLQHMLNNQSNTIFPLSLSELTTQTDIKKQSIIDKTFSYPLSDFLLQEKLNSLELTSKPQINAKNRTEHQFETLKQSTQDNVNLSKYNFLAKTLKKQEKSASFWQHGWATAYGAGAIKTFLERDDMVSDEKMLKNSIAITNAVLAFGIHNSIDRYPNRYSQKSIFSNRSLTKQEKVEAAENLFKQRAGFVKRTLSFKDRIGSYGIALVSTAILYDRGNREDAYTNFGLSLIGIETARRSLPTRALKDWNAYQSMNFQSNAELELKNDPFMISLVPTFNGLQFNMAF